MSSKVEKELLTDLLEGVQATHHFLSIDLSHEHLSHDNDLKRQRYIETLSSLAMRIHSSHPSIRPRMDTPSNITKLPAPKPPLPPPVPEEVGGQQMYIECEPPEPLAEDYLPFEPTHRTNGDAPQELYEQMSPTDDVQAELYEDPVAVVSPQPEDTPSDHYEDPVALSPNLHPSPTPPSSRENSGSGAVYTQTAIPPTLPEEAEVEHDWDYDYTQPKENKVRVSELKGVVQKGYLEKLGGRNRKSWQRRYCVQAGPLMYFYEKESSKSYNNRIVLPSYVVNPAAEHSNAKRKQFAFKLSHTDMKGKLKDYVFRTQSDKDRGKWIESIRGVCEKAAGEAASRVSVTLPRNMPSQHPSPLNAARAKRASSVGDAMEELYEDIHLEEEEEGGGIEEYVAVTPVDDGPEEEYVDVVPGQREDDDIPQEEYEDTSSFQVRPPPPSSPLPPATPPHTSTSSLQSSVPFAPPPPLNPPPPSKSPEPSVDTSLIYSPRQNGIKYENVYVALWDFAASEQDELNLRRGDLVYVAEPRENTDWWFGELLDEEATCKKGVRGGLFPSSYASYAFQSVS